MVQPRPSVFIGSSTEGLAFAKAIQQNLDHACDTTVWSQGVFGLGGGTLESLVDRLDDFDFAILVLTPEDLVESRKKQQQSPRDNVLLELGLFIGGIGRKRTFMVYDRTKSLKLPSDLAGVTPATFQQQGSGNLQASLGAGCTQIENAIGELGPRVRQAPGTAVDQNTQFQVISDLLEDAARQFFILMHETGRALRRESFWGGGLQFYYAFSNRSLGQGQFSVDGFISGFFRRESWSSSGGLITKQAARRLIGIIRRIQSKGLRLPFHRAPSLTSGMIEKKKSAMPE